MKITEIIFHFTQIENISRKFQAKNLPIPLVESFVVAFWQEMLDGGWSDIEMPSGRQIIPYAKEGVRLRIKVVKSSSDKNGTKNLIIFFCF